MGRTIPNRASVLWELKPMDMAFKGRHCYVHLRLFFFPHEKNGSGMKFRCVWKCAIPFWSGWWARATPLKNMTSSIGMMTYPTKMGKCQKWQPNHQPAFLSHAIFSIKIAPLRGCIPHFSTAQLSIPMKWFLCPHPPIFCWKIPHLHPLIAQGFHISWWNPTCSASKLRCRSEIVGCRSRHFLRPHTGSVQTPCCFSGEFHPTHLVVQPPKKSSSNHRLSVRSPFFAA